MTSSAPMILTWRSVDAIHSPRTTTVAEMVKLIEKAVECLSKESLWVDPDCGLKTRNWEDARIVLANMFTATQELRKPIPAEA